MTTVLTQPVGVWIGKRALHQLRAVLERETGAKAALLLREVGFANGEAISEGFEQWCRRHYQVDTAGGLDAAYLGEALAGFFTETGWGEVSITEVAPHILALDGTGWAEAPGREPGAEYPSCHFSCGLLADFFTRLGNSRAAVMEVECVSRGENRCRFLIGSPDLLTSIYERMTSGMSYSQALPVGSGP